jgi:diguanylate cyclase (GGDEF)-like protein
MSNLTAARGLPNPRRPGGGADPDDAGKPADGVSGENPDENVLHWNERTVVRREPRPDGSGTEIHKRALGPAAVERARHERSVLERLAGVPGVSHLLGGGTDDTLVLEDLAGRPLGSVIASGEITGDPARICALALALARILGKVHDAGVIHRDLNPGNVLVALGPTGELEPAIVDFDLATTLAQVRPSFIDPREIVGQLPYLAPEQTGRTGTPVDQRSDLYALGVLFYELTTGAPPFTDDDPLHLVGQILSRRPVPPDRLADRLPVMFSRIVVRLLQKEPDDRYFGAAGLAHDLARVVADPETEFTLGQRDFPQRLAPPTRLVGRAREVTLLSEALDQAITGSVQGVLVCGAPGVGKSVLINQLRPLVATRGGWFAPGKADQYRHDATTTLFSEAMDRLGALLLTEPEEELNRLRRRLLAALGDNAGLVTALVPALRQLLGVEPDDWTSHEGSEVSARLLQAAPDLLREIVSPQRPLVLFLDDLQWATARPLQTIDTLLGDPGLRGLLVVGAYRDAEVDAAHPLTGMIERWERLGITPTRLRLGNLPVADVASLIAEMLRIAPEDAARLSAVLGERTDGNPFDTVELINALRRDGALVLGEQGWTWDAATIRGYVGTGDVVDLLTDRIAQLPEDCREVLRIMARLGVERPVRTLAAACALEPAELVRRLMPAIEDGLVVADDSVREQAASGAASLVRFRHDRVQQAAHGGVQGDDRGSGLVLARRLLETDDLDAAAQQYIEVVDLLEDPTEQGRVIELFRTVAARARRVSQFSFVDRYLLAATNLHERTGGGPHDPVSLALDADRHAALYALGRLDEADELYEQVAAHTPQAIDLTGSACLQIASLTNRGRLPEALELGLGLLDRLGICTPADVRQAAAEGFDRADRWLDEVTLAAEVARDEPADPTAPAAAAVLARLCPTAYFMDHVLLAWLVTEAQRLWAEHGPQPDLVPCLAHSNAHGVGLRASTDLDHRVVDHAIAVGEARGYRATTAHAHFLNAVVMSHWYSPLEDVVAEARDARETLRRTGELQNACFAFYPAVIGLVDCGQTLDGVLGEADAALVMARRTGNDQVAESLVAYRQLARALRGETRQPMSFSADDFDEEAHLAAIMVTNPMAGFYFHLLKALGAAVLGEPGRLDEALQALEPLRQIVAGTYGTSQVQLLAGLSAAHRLEAGADVDRDRLLAVLDSAHDMLATVAETAPVNFRHLERFLEAERARAVGDVAAALRGYDEALCAADTVTRPWHSGLIAERAGTYALGLGYERLGQALIGEARRQYHRWGATVKVHALDAAYPWAKGRRAPESSEPNSPSSTVGVTSDSIDMLAILAASQAIGSQTDPDRLRAVLVEQVQTLTGATDVLLVLPDDDGRWLLQPGRVNTEPVEVEAAGERGLLPLGAFRYAERTREPLLVGNAVADGRFTRDRYISERARCSLLVVPVLGAGSLRAVLLLVNDLATGAFTTERVDAVHLIAGQLAVSLDNAQLYRSLEAKVASRTEALQAAKEQLEQLSVTDALTEVANRRQFDASLVEEWERGRARSWSIAVLMIDIDYFKQYNDALGHLAGDECIQAVARALTQTVRASDIVCRYGGEEFAIILPNAELRQAFSAAQRAHAAIRALEIPHPGQIGRVTVSIGVAARVPDDEQDPQSLVAAADEALYAAKHAGRDQVVATSPGSLDGV